MSEQDHAKNKRLHETIADLDCEQNSLLGGQTIQQKKEQAAFESGRQAQAEQDAQIVCPACRGAYEATIKEVRLVTILGEQRWVHGQGAGRIICAAEKIRRSLSQPAASAPDDEIGWLIERGGLCLGFCEHKLTWVAFTNDQAWRFARRSDAIRLIEAYGEDFGLQNVLVTEHMWNMKVRTDFHTVNLATGEKVHSIVGEGQVIDERVGSLSQLEALKAWEHWYSVDSSEFNRDTAREMGLKVLKVVPRDKHVASAGSREGQHDMQKKENTDE